MTKSLSNKLKYVILIEVLLLILFNVVVFAVPFNNKYNPTFWISYATVYVAMIVIFGVISILFTQDKYQTKKCVNRIFLYSFIFSIASIAASLILIVVNGSNAIEVYIPVVIIAILDVLMIFLMVATLISSDKDEMEAE